MKHKIKNKYLQNISNKQKRLKVQELNEEIKDTEAKIKNTFKSFGLILLLLFWSYIPLIILMGIGIDYNNFSNIGKIFYITFCDVTLILFLLLIYKKDIIKDFKNFFNKDFFNNFKISLKYWSIGLAIMIISNLFISIITNGAIAGNEESVRELIDKMPLYMLFQIIIYAPLTEEIIFRKSIKDIFNNKYLYILTSGLIFGGLHVVSSLNSTLDLLYLIPYCSLGIAFAALYTKTNNIFSTISVHALHNLLTFTLYLISCNL